MRYAKFQSFKVLRNLHIKKALTSKRYSEG